MCSYNAQTQIEFDLLSHGVMQDNIAKECENYILSVLPGQCSQQIFPNDPCMHKIRKNVKQLIFNCYLYIFFYTVTMARCLFGSTQMYDTQCFVNYNIFKFKRCTCQKIVVYRITLQFKYTLQHKLKIMLSLIEDP